MKITAEHHGRIVTIEDPDVVYLRDFLEMLYGVAIGLTFPDELWRHVIIELASFYQREDSNPTHS